MKWLWRSLAIVFFLAACIWLWLALNPGPEKVIRTRLDQLAGQISFSPPESDLTRLGKIAGLPRFFAPEVEVKLAFRDVVQRGMITHEFIQAAAAELRQNASSGLKFEFLDVNVTLAPSKQFATAELTMKATTPGDNQFDVQEMKFALGKTNDTWLIYRLETVRTLK